MKISTIGGNVTENSGGLRGLKYGVTRNYVMGLEVILPDGQVRWQHWTDRAIFDEAVKRAGTSAAETMYVGDNYFADILGAQNAGVKAILLDPDGLFPEATCPVIRQIAELPDRLIHFEQ